MEENSSIYMSVVLQVVVGILIIFFVMRYAHRTSENWKSFVHFGHATDSTSVDVMGIQIDTWNKWFFLQGVLCTIEGINTWSYKKYKKWYTHSIHGERGTTIVPGFAVMIISLWRLATFVPITFKWFVSITTRQLQFLIPPLFVRILCSGLLDYHIVTECYQCI